MNNRPEDFLKQLLDDYRGQPNHTADYLPGLAAFGLGIVVGAGVALLFAPSSGEELREEIVDRVDGLKNRAVGEDQARDEASASTPVA